MRTIVFLLLILYFNLSLAQPLFEEISVPLDEDLGWILPNEVYPIHGLPIFVRNNGGAYVSVGTERGFMGAALARANRLILLDMAPNVVRYNRLNVALLKLSKNRADYFSLRTNPVELELRIKELADDNSIFYRDGNLDWWAQNVARDADFDIFHFPQKVFDEFKAENKKDQYGDVDPFFTDSNYLYDDELFARIWLLATQDLIESHLIDLKTVSDVWVAQLGQALSSQNEKIGIVDLSNVLDHEYLGIHGVTRLTKMLARIACSNSILLQTFEGDTRWSYHGWSFDFLQKEGIFQVLTKFNNHLKYNPKYSNVGFTLNFVGVKARPYFWRRHGEMVNF